jgi:D-alanyl-D-alanine carboxypeptidase
VGIVLAGTAAVVWRGSDEETQARPELQRLLDGLVSGPGRVAPGATAYVIGPRGSWSGAAGVANVRTREPMRADARMRLLSVSKLWTAVLILRLVEKDEIGLDDTVGALYPGLLPRGARITLRQLLNNTSGLIDDNDISSDPRRYLDQVSDPGLRAELLLAGERLAGDPEYEVPTRLMIRFAAALPLLSEPGTAYHYSNIGYQVAGLLAERVTGESLAALFQREIVEPLSLENAAYDPRSRITGPHAHGYRLSSDGKLTDTTGRVADLGANGGVVSNARDEAHFLVALMGGRLLGRAQLAALKTPSPHQPYGLGTSIEPTGCAGTGYTHGGAGAGFATRVYVSGDGRRVAVLFLNARTPGGYGDELAERTALQLFCAA